MEKEFKVHLKEELAFYDTSFKKFLIGYESWYMGNYIRFMRYSEYYENKKQTLPNKLYGGVSKIIMRWFGRRTGFQIGLHSCDWGIKIYHWGPIIINSHAKVGKNLTISPCCTIGRVGNYYPVVGNNCTICQGAKVVGNVHIGNNVTIANNSVVTKSIADNCIVGGIPAIIIKIKS